MGALTHWPTVRRFEWVRASKGRYIVIDNRHHVIFASTETEDRARRIATMANRSEK